MTLLINIISNPKEQVQTITLKSEKEVELPKQIRTEPTKDEGADNDEFVQAKEAKPREGTNMHEAEHHHTKLTMSYPLNLWPNPYMEKKKREGAEPIKNNEEHVKPSKRSPRIKKSSREFNSKNLIILNMFIFLSTNI